MRKHRTKIVVAAVICVALIGAWFLGGAPDINTPGVNGSIASEVENSYLYQAEEDDQLLGNGNAAEDASSEMGINSDINAESHSSTNTGEESDTLLEYIDDDLADTQGESADYDVANTPEEPDNTTQAGTENGLDAPSTPDDTQSHPTGTETPNENQPETTPEPTISDDESFTVTLTVRVDMLLYNMHLLDSDKHELVPQDGFIFPRTAVTAYPGESVFNVLQREMRRARIHMASRFTPVFNSAYIEAINNLYEFDAGALSGWVYSVNGSFPSFGSSRYLVGPDYEIVWYFTLDRGRDVGAILPPGGQEDE